MCTNFRPPTSRIVADMRGLEGVPPPAADWPDEAFPGYLAPIVVLQPAGPHDRPASQHLGQPDKQRRSQSSSPPDGPPDDQPDSPPALRCVLARFGLVPRWSRDAGHAAELARRTHNARSETVAERPSFRTPWRERQYALVPMLNYFEPCWESGRAERWRIARADAEPFAVAALHERWTDRNTGERVHSFSLLTVNADQHPLMGRMHRPGEEKRMLVIVPPGQYAHWLQATPGEAATLLALPPEVLLAGAPEPRPPTRAQRPATARPAASMAPGRPPASAPDRLRDYRRHAESDAKPGGHSEGAALPAQGQLDF